MMGVDGGVQTNRFPQRQALATRVMHTNRRTRDSFMPSLFRFLTVIAVLAGLVYGAAFALTIFVEPEQREMTQRVDSRRLNPQ